MSSLLEHAKALQKALERACAEHGTPNTFSFGELHAFHGGPPSGQVWAIGEVCETRSIDPVGMNGIV